MSRTPPAVQRKPSGVKVMLIPGERPPSLGLSSHTESFKENGSGVASKHTSLLNAEREVEILNHCFDDVERFMVRLQQTAEAQSILNQKKSRNKKSKRKEDKEDSLVAMKACPPSEEEFTDLFQKTKYSLSLLDRLKTSISEPDAPELLHHIFVPLSLMVKTTGGPALAASVVSPALTRGAISLLQQHLTDEEKDLWTSLGPNWTSSCSQLNMSVSPYSPVFLDGWQPGAMDSSAQPLDDPIALQHKLDALSKGLEQQHPRGRARLPAEAEDHEEGGALPPESEKLFCCSYDFVARNSSELSVLQGETLEVIESSKRWWKCRNRFDQIGFVPSNILEPLSALGSTGESPAISPITPQSKYFTFASTSPDVKSPTAMSPTEGRLSAAIPSTPRQGDETDRVLMMNDELLQRLARRRSSGTARPAALQRAGGAPHLLNYHSQPPEVVTWLTSKGFSQQTVKDLGILNGAQLFSLNKSEFLAVLPQEGGRVYSQIMVQKALLQDEHKFTELETVMQRQKLKVDQGAV